MRILIVDDEPLARQRLRTLLDEFTDFECEVIGEAVNGEEGLTQALNLHPDVILLDIRMPSMNGLQVAQHLSSMGEAPAIIFTTAYDEHALAAFDAQAIGYLLKPVRKHKLLESLQRAERLSKRQMQVLVEENDDVQRDRFCISKRGQLNIISISDICYFMADQKYVSIFYFKEGQLQEEIIDDTLKDLEREFPQAFLRVHRNALVANKYIEKLTHNDDGHYHVHLGDGIDPIAVSRRQVKAVKSILKN